MVIIVDAVLALFWVLVEVTVREVPVVGAVSMPAGVIVPAEVDQVTAEE